MSIETSNRTDRDPRWRLVNEHYYTQRPDPLDDWLWDQGLPQAAERVFWLKYLLSSQSAILWMGLLFFMSSCTSSLVRVKPYERGNLAKPIMSSERESLLLAMTNHAYFSREASFGGGGVGGGGCGCN